MAAEVGLAAFSSIVSEGAKSLFKPIIRQISYVFKYQSYIDELKDQVKRLEHKREMVQQPVNHARLQGDEIYEGVTDWLNKVDEFSEAVAKSIIDYEDRAKKSCFKGSCPNLISRYKLSKQAAKAAEAAAGLMGNGNFPESFDSRKKVLQDVMEALKDDKLNIIGVYGMGGVGKTTLVRQVRKQVMEDKLFDKVVMAELTQPPDHQEIQNKLAFDLGMEFGLNENEFQRAERLHERLKKEKQLLIILDNIWTKLELDKIGIPTGDVAEKDRKEDQRRCTIILTSRSRDLLRIDMNSQKNFPIDALPRKEALQLFEKIVGDSTKISAFQSIANEIVERCGGLPVALSTVANAMKNKGLAIWKDALNQLRRSDAREIHGMHANVYTSIKLSYKLLESKEAQSMFRLCGLHSEGHAIQVASLLRYGVGWGLFANVYTLEEARSRVHTLICKLKSSCLLLDGDAEDEVKMHDIIHAVAVSIAEEELMFNIPNVAYVEKKMEETIREGPIAISLPYRDIQELPERLECPRLELLLLFSKRDSSLQISDHFFQGTEELKVLDFTGIFFSSLPSSLGCLINVQTLCLDGCRLNDITIIGQLRKLEILSFRDSDVKELPLVIGQLTRLQLLDLSNCSSLVVIAPNVISKLSRLEELYIGNSFSQWENVEGGSNASLVELKGLSKLTTLEIHVRDAEILPQDLVSVELQSYRICIGNKWWSSWSVKSGLSRLMKLQGLEKFGILLQNYRMKLLLKRTEYLYLGELKGVQNVVHELDDGEGFPRLKHLRVESCFEILHIVGSVGRVRRKVFPLLESLSLIGLINLETICDSQLTEDQSFSNLRIIEVKSCDKLKHLFSFSIAKNLLRLQKVEVDVCDDLEMIVGPDREKPTTSLGFNEIIADDDPAPKDIFPSLEELKLKGLRSIEKLWPDHNQGMYCCQNLTKVIVHGCHHMKYLFSYSMIYSLLQLQHLEISACKSIEGVVDATGRSERDEGKLIELKVFPKLHSLRLSLLPKLTSFANMGHIHSDSVVEFPSLQILKIRSCSSMSRFISTSSSEDTIHFEMEPPPLFDEKGRYPSLEVLYISSMDKLRKVWHHQLASESFSKLKKLHIQSCDNLMNIYPPLVHCKVFPLLESLSLNYLINLETICDSQLTEDQSFSNLRVIDVEHCDKLKHLFSFSIAKNLLRLQKVEVADCDKIKMIVGPDREKPTTSLGFNEIIADDDPAPKVHCKVFPLLESLSLNYLINLETICDSQLTEDQSFSNLRVIDVEHCDKLKHLFSFSIAKNLLRLQKVEVADCDKMKMIVGPDREKPTTSLGFNEIIADDDPAPKDIFPSLEELKLKGLRSIEKLWPDHNQGMYCCQNLTKVIVHGCHHMKYLFSYSMIYSLLQLQHLEISACKSIEGVADATGRSERDEGKLIELKVFPKLHSLRLSLLPKLTSFANMGHIHSDSVVEFPSLQILKIRSCSSMSRFISTSSSEDTIHFEMEPPPLFDEKGRYPSLEVLYISSMDKLRKVWHHQLASESFSKLKKLHIQSCDNLMNIYPPLVHCKVFPLLESLSLNYLINLETICDSQLTEDQSFSNLRVIDVEHCDKLKHLFSFSIAKNLLRLQKVEVADCDKIKMIVGPDKEKPTTSLGFNEIIADDDPAPKVIFPSLEELKLKGLRSIEKLWPDHNQGMYCCQNLSKLTVWDCHRLKYLFSYSMVSSLVQLQHLEISLCRSMEGVVDTMGWSGRDEGKLIELKVLPKLHSLRLFLLPKLISFANMGHIHSDSVVEFPSLLKLKIKHCFNMLRFISTSASEDDVHTKTKPEPFFDEKVQLPSLEVLYINSMDKLRKIWHHQLALESFSKLKNLEIFGCDKLMNIFPPLVGIPSSLVNLKVLSCGKIEEIIGHVGEEVKENRIAFSKLKLLKLDDLPRLTSFCLENYTLEFPSLERVSMTHCLNIKTFSRGILSTPKLSKVHVTEKEEDELCHWEGNLNSTIQKLYDEMVLFHGLFELKLSRLPKVLHIWNENSESNKVLPNLTILEMSECSKLQNLVPSSWHLENLNISGSIKVSWVNKFVDALNICESYKNEDS